MFQIWHDRHNCGYTFLIAKKIVSTQNERIDFLLRGQYYKTSFLDGHESGEKKERNEVSFIFQLQFNVKFESWKNWKKK